LATGMQGYKIFNAADTSKIMEGGNTGFDDYGIKNAFMAGANKTVKAIKNIPQVTFDKRGNKISERSGLHNKTYLTKKIYD